MRFAIDPRDRGAGTTVGIDKEVTPQEASSCESFKLLTSGARVLYPSDVGLGAFSDFEKAVDILVLKQKPTAIYKILIITCRLTRID